MRGFQSVSHAQDATIQGRDQRDRKKVFDDLIDRHTTCAYVATAIYRDQCLYQWRIFNFFLGQGVRSNSFMP